MSLQLDIALAAAEAAGAILLQESLQKVETLAKDGSRTSIVTAVDLAAQAKIAGIILDAFPDHAIVGEEGDAGDQSSEHVWFIDPLDGTTNYAHGYPVYCVSIAHCDARGVAHAVIYDPVQKNVFAAVRGEGATHNKTRMRVSATRNLSSSLLSTQVQSDDPIMLDRFAARSRSFVGAARALRTVGAPALALAYVARGWLDAFCETDMSPWDTLAGGLLIEEAGGRVSTFSGKSRPLRERSSILGTNALLHAELVNLLEVEERHDPNQC